jgi:predicted nucleotidyltransferase
MQAAREKAIIDTVLRHFPGTQAIFLFGTFGTPDERPDSDVDIALLLPHDQAKSIGPLALTPCHADLEQALERDVDFINARQVDTVLQKEIIGGERRIFTGDAFAADEFEMLTLSYYQDLNIERRKILEDIARRGKVLDV